MKYFENITAEELNILEDAVSQIAVLIAGADGKIEKDETDWVSKLMHIRTYSGDDCLHSFYEEVEANFNIKFRDLIKNSSADLAQTQATLSALIARVNPILAQIDPRTAYQLYHSYITLAKSIAKSSGGILGFGSISGAEEKWIHLPMITPVAKPISDIEKDVED